MSHHYPEDKAETDESVGVVLIRESGDNLKELDALVAEEIQVPEGREKSTIISGQTREESHYTDSHTTQHSQELDTWCIKNEKIRVNLDWERVVSDSLGEDVEFEKQQEQQTSNRDVLEQQEQVRDPGEDPDCVPDFTAATSSREMSPASSKNKKAKVSARDRSGKKGSSLPWACDRCLKAFASQSSLGKHSRSCKCLVTHQCDLCTLKIGGIGAMNVHRRSHFCSVQLVDVMALSSWPASGKETIIGGLVNATLHDKPDEKGTNHGYSSSAGESLARCDGFSNSYLEGVMANNEVRSRCDKGVAVDGEKFDNSVRQDALLRSTSTSGSIPKNLRKGKHRSHKRHKCTQCEKGFDLETSLLSHLKSHQIQAHVGNESDNNNRLCQDSCPGSTPCFKPQKLYRCMHCEKGYKWKKSLASHLKVHRIRAPVLENYGNTLQQDALSGSISRVIPKNRRKHRSHKRYKCSYCEKGYDLNASLLIHLKSHQISEKSDDTFSHNLISGTKSESCQKRQSLLHTFYKCKNCDKFFNLKSSLADHMKSHQIDAPLKREGDFICDSCGLRFNDKETITKHMLTHELSNSLASCTQDEVMFYKCTFCDKSYRRKRDLSNHIFRHPVDGFYECNLCTEKFNLFDDLRVHRNTHPEVGRFQCKVCGKMSTKASKLKIHMRTHTGEKPFACDLCPQTFKRKDGLKQHRKVHADDPGSLPCDFCPKTFKCLVILEEHRKVHTVDSSTSGFKCELCPKTFKYPVNLRQHQGVHTTNPIFKCEFCPKKFKYAVNLKQHQVVHTTTRVFECKFCDSSFKRADKLKAHLAVHTSARPFQCKSCPATFKQRKHLVRHTKTVHDPKKEYERGVCLTTYSVTSRTPKKHVTYKTSSRERPFKCDICSKTFYTAQRHEVHLAAKHSEKRDFECDQCSDTFQAKSTLAAHINSCHEDKRVFSCVVCLNAFSTFQHLEVHSALHGSTDTRECLVEIAGAGARRSSDEKVDDVQSNRVKNEVPWENDDVGVEPRNYGGDGKDVASSEGDNDDHDVFDERVDSGVSIADVDECFNETIAQNDGLIADSREIIEVFEDELYFSGQKVIDSLNGFDGGNSEEIVVKCEVFCEDTTDP